MSEPKCIVMSAGDFAPVDLDIRKDDYVIAADNGLTYLTRMGIVPDYVIGDYDSLQQEGRDALVALQQVRPDTVMTLPVEKDDTDTMAAARVGLARGYKVFYLYGALGGARLDHTLANIQTLAFLKENGASAYMIGERCELFVLENEERRFEPGFRGAFSLFAMDREIRGVTIRGMKYEVEDLTIPNHYPIGVSNHIESDRQAVVSVRDGRALCYVAWD